MDTPTFKNVGQAVNHFFTGTDKMSRDEVINCVEWVQKHAEKGCIWIEYRLTPFGDKWVKTVDGWRLPG